MASVRMVLMLVSSIGERTETWGVTIALIGSPSVLVVVRPFPAGDFRAVHAMFVRVVAAVDLHVAETLLGLGADSLEAGRAVDGIDRQAEAIGFVVYRQFHRRIDIALLLVAAHMKIDMIRAPVGEAMDQPRIA